jgi:hypothetical protein
MSSVSSLSAATLEACARRASTAFFAWAEEKDDGSGSGWADLEGMAAPLDEDDGGGMSDDVEA